MPLLAPSTACSHQHSQPRQVTSTQTTSPQTAPAGPEAPQHQAQKTPPTSSSSSSNLGPGPRRFRGDVPAFNPSNSSPHLYSQQIHQYAPQPPASSPVYPTHHPQYFSQQPQFIPYAGSMMPYYPVAMGYPDYSVYQPYQYYAMPTGQFQNPSAYMPMNGMPNGAANGYVPNRKKHFKSHHNNNNHHHQNYNNGHLHNNNYYNNTSSFHQNGGSAHSYSKHSSPSTHSLHETPEPNGSADSRASEVNNSEPVPRIDNSANSTPPQKSETITSTVEEELVVASSDATTADLTPEELAEEKVETTEINEESHETKEENPLSDIPEPQVALPKEVEETPSPKKDLEKEIPLFFNMTQQELIESHNLVFGYRTKLLNSKWTRINDLTEAESDSDYLIDTKRIFQIIDHDNGSEYKKELGSSLPQTSPTKTNDNENNDSNTPKPQLNWASLLQSTIKKTKKVKTQTPPNGGISPKPAANSISAVPTSTDRSQSLGLLLMSMLYDPAFNLNAREPFKLKPRGLTNTGNICYMNAVLQCLLFCGPFNKMLRTIEEKSLGSLGKTSLTPVLDAMINFMNDFSTLSSSNKSSGTSVNSEGIVVGRPLSPEKLYMKLVESPKFQHLKWGQQEDAEEFLVYLLDGLHEDFVKAEATVSNDQMEQLASLYGQKLDSTRAEDLKARMKQASRLVRHTGSSAVENKEEIDEDKSERGWSEVAGRGKVSSKRVAEVEPSPITSVFGGLFRSVLTIPKSKESHSITVDPYRSISLDISSDDVKTIEDALWKLNEVEKLPYKNEEGVEVVAQKQTYIEELPEVLTLQLKRFSFQHKNNVSENGSDSKENGTSDFHGVGTIEKVSKNVSYGLDLTIPVEALSPGARNVQNRNYSLIGVIYHHGRNAEGGHYTCDVSRGDKKWLRIDDTAVEPIDADSVTGKPDAKGKSAYIFIYQRKHASKP
ncbi:hypothetical protein JCM33374_g489 [Metschnikowia sp. JCM 33374]|nr:hypothetical protein JCM33374_g489 [Metschnikowia sp. JCM 33374]